MSDKRRDVLKKMGAIAGSSIAYPMTSRTVTAEDSVDTTSTAEAGITDEVEELMDNGKYQQARDLMDRNGVTHDTGVTVLNNPYESSQGQVGTSDFGIKSQASMPGSTYVSGSEDFDNKTWDIITVDYDWDIPCQKDIDAPAPKDPVSVYWESNVFGYKQGTLEHSNVQRYSGGYSDVSGTSEKGTGDLTNGTEGVGVLVDDRAKHVDETQDPEQSPVPIFCDRLEGGLKLKLRRQNKSYGNIRVEYGHTWSVGGSVIGDLLNNIELSAGSPVTYKFGWSSTDQWDIHKPTDI